MPKHKMERFTGRARHVLSLAQETAEVLQHNQIGTEHLLLGLMREEKSIAALVLHDMGVEEEKVIALIAELTHSTPRSVNTALDLSSETKRVLELAVDEARRMGHHYIGTEHLLLGLVRQAEGMSIHVLKRLDVRTRGRTVADKAGTTRKPSYDFEDKTKSH